MSHTDTYIYIHTNTYSKVAAVKYICPFREAGKEEREEWKGEREGERGTVGGKG